MTQIPVAGSSTASGTVPPTQALTPSHSFQWYVGSVSTNGQAIVWSAGQKFTIAPLAPPTLNPLSSPQTSTTVTFTWHTVTDAGSYELWVSDNSRTSGKVTTVSKIAGSFTTLTLTSGHSYTWYVAAVSTNTVVTVWSTGSTFSVQ